MKSLAKESDSQSPLLAEEWLSSLVETIKKEDHAVAEREYQATRRAEMIAQNGPVFWKKFTVALEGIFRQMDDLFGDHVTKGKISFLRSPYGGGISINKSAYPFVSFSATPNFSETTAHFTYTVVNPEIPNNIGVPGRFLPCRFGMEGDDVVMNLDGRLFATPESAAKFIIEKLFTIPSTAPLVVMESPAAATQDAVNQDDTAVPTTETAAGVEVPIAASAAVETAPAEIQAVAAVVEPPAPVVEASLPVPAPAPMPASPLALTPPPLPGSMLKTRIMTVPPRPRQTEAPTPSYASRLLATASRIILGGSSESKALSIAVPTPAIPAAIAIPERPVEAVAATETAVVEPTPIEPAVVEPAVVEPVEQVAPAECSAAVESEVAPVECAESTLETEPLESEAETLSESLADASVSRIPRRRYRMQQPRPRPRGNYGPPRARFRRMAGPVSESRETAA